MTITLKYTADEVRDREVVHLGLNGRPNPWWPGGNATNDCVGRQTFVLGLREGTESLDWLISHPYLISIAAFRAHFGWHEVPVAQLMAGDLLCENWDGDRFDDGTFVPGHMEYLYSIDEHAQSMSVIAANTGPAPGVAVPNGLHRKTRAIDEHILFGIRPPYREVQPSRARRAEVIAVAGFVNKHVPPPLARTTSVRDGIEGPNYWRLVQTYGRAQHWYPPECAIDGVPGPKSRAVEAAIYKIARAGK